MKYLILLALLVCGAIAQEVEIEDEQPQIEEAVAAFIPINVMNRMRYSAFNPQMMMSNPPPQQAVEYYSQMKDEDFPVDYSLTCSNSCGCRQYCMTFWWMMCGCSCAPPCPIDTTTEEPQARFPPIEWNPLPPNRPQIRPPRPEPIDPPTWNRPNRPNWNNDPHNPNNHLTFPPTERAPPTQSPWNNQPPIWNPNNPNNHLTHPPRVTTVRPPMWNRPQQPEIPWWQQPQQPQQPQHPDIPWWQEQQPQFPQWPQQPQQPQWPQLPQPEPLPQPEVPWWQQPQFPQPLPELNPPQWQNNNQFPQWNQPPSPYKVSDWLPQETPIEDLCDDTCSCQPCSVIWICPVQCSTSCCAARRFGDAAIVEEVDKIVDSLIDFKIPDYLKDVFIPGLI